MVPPIPHIVSISREDKIVPNGFGGTMNLASHSKSQFYNVGSFINSFEQRYCSLSSIVVITNCTDRSIWLAFAYRLAIPIVLFFTSLLKTKASTRKRANQMTPQTRWTYTETAYKGRRNSALVAHSSICLPMSPKAACICLRRIKTLMTLVEPDTSTPYLPLAAFSIITCQIHSALTYSFIT